MRAIGFRVDSATAVHYAVVDGPAENPMLADDGKLVLAPDGAGALKLLRTQLLSLLSAQQPAIAAIRFADRPKGRANPLAMLPRARVEGVVMEAVATFGITVFSGPAATIKSGMKTKSPLSRYTESDDVRGIDLSKKRNKFLREAVVAAISALGR